MAGWKNDLGDLLARDGFPASIEVVLKQQTVGKVHHPKMLKFEGRMPLERSVAVQSSSARRASAWLVLAMSCWLTAKRTTEVATMVFSFEPSYFEVTQTRIDIEASCNPIHGRGTAASASRFYPTTSFITKRGLVGMDGEMQWLDAAMHPLSPVSTPHPMRVRQGVITDGHLIATWLDRELMLACMGAIPWVQPKTESNDPN